MQIKRNPFFPCIVQASKKEKAFSFRHRKQNCLYFHNLAIRQEELINEMVFYSRCWHIID